MAPDAGGDRSQLHEEELMARCAYFSDSHICKFVSGNLEVDMHMFGAYHE